MENQTKENGKEKKPKKYEKFAYGLLMIKSENSNFNADFSGLPRRLPDKENTIYATDKALKYCIRRYIHDICPKEKVFAWRRKNKNLEPFDIGENYSKLFPNGTQDKRTILKDLLSCVDLRLFGVTYAKGGNKDDKNAVSFTGPVQISYGINRLERNVFYSNQILSPYRNPDQEKGIKQQTTVGSESKGLESWYVYEIIVNPNNLKDALDVLEKPKKAEEPNKEAERETLNNKDNPNEQSLFLSTDDIGLLKKALCRAVTYVNSCSKIGSESAMLLFAETKNMISCPIFPMLKDEVTIKLPDKPKDNTKESKDKTNNISITNKYIIDLTGIFNGLNNSFALNEEEKETNTLEERKKEKTNGLTYELYYDDNRLEVKGQKGCEEYHIRTLKKIGQ